jgi:hypothetical protein
MHTTDRFALMACSHCDKELEVDLYENSIGEAELKQFFERTGINKAGVCWEAKIPLEQLNRVLYGIQPLDHELAHKLFPIMIYYGYWETR